MITQTYDINLIPSSLVTLIRCSQYDTDLRTLVFNLYDDDTLFDATGYTVRLGGTKPDKTGFLYDMTVNGSQVSLAITEQMTAVAGPVVCEITVYDNNEGRASTVNFILQVERSALAGTEISETEIPLLQEAIDASATVISLSETFGSPLVAQTAAEMTLTNRVYVYTGSESGYTYGNWYYYDGTAWRSGGAYQSAAVTVDSELSTTSNNPVQNKVVTAELNQKAPVIISHAEGAVASFSDGADDMPVSDLSVSIEPAQSGSGDPSPTNVRPISGWDSMTVTRAVSGNLLDITAISRVLNGITITVRNDGSITLNGTATDQVSLLIGNTEDLPSGRYYYAGIPYGASSTTYFMSRNSSSGNTYTDGAYDMSGILRPRIYVREGVTCNDVVFHPMIFANEDVTLYTISLDNAGTVYGGTLDVTTGLLTVDRTMIEGTSDNIRRNNATQYYINTGDAKITGSSYGKNEGLLSNQFFAFESGMSSSLAGMTFVNSGGAIRFNTTDSYASVSDLLSSLGTIQFVYPLATPQTYQLTPTEVKTLLGYNNIFAYTGASSVDYCADTKLYIDGLSQLDDDMIADANIASGKYFTVNNKLYLSTAAIAQGASIVVGTNCIETNLAEALNALNA